VARLKRGSYEKFNYLLRPSKQVERKLIIEVLHRLASAGVAIADYTYLGFGSVYYADFVLFHKYLYINDMICVEKSDIPKRMRFNKPYEFIRLEMKEVAQLIPEIDRDRRYVVWLDYDYGLSRDVLNDIESFMHVLSPGSILLMTVDAEPRLPEELDEDRLTEEHREELLVRVYREQLSKYARRPITKAVLAPNVLPTFLAEVLRTQLNESARKRRLQFSHLFNFRYADGAQMLTVGGMIATPELEEAIGRSRARTLPFVVDQDEPVEIYAPPLTVREKQWLEQHITPDLTVNDLEFELSEEYLASFKLYYRQYPTYYETLT
jgi:hypothetical protein